MTHDTVAVEALPGDASLDLEALCRLAGVEPRWVRQRAADGLLALEARGDDAGWRFDAALLRRVRCMARVERDFDAVAELAALVADLEDEVARLRERLAALGAG